MSVITTKVPIFYSTEVIIAYNAYSEFGILEFRCYNRSILFRMNIHTFSIKLSVEIFTAGHGPYVFQGCRIWKNTEITRKL